MAIKIISRINNSKQFNPKIYLIRLTLEQGENIKARHLIENNITGQELNVEMNHLIATVYSNLGQCKKSFYYSLQAYEEESNESNAIFVLQELLKYSRGVIREIFKSNPNSVSKEEELAKIISFKKKLNSYKEEIDSEREEH